MVATLKCKMCGGDLQLIEDENICECEYCGTKQTVPTVDDDKKRKLYERANKLRFNCDFDKAAGVYESIANDYPDDAECYWGLILCNYGIEYVDDPATGKKVPTCHRSSFESLMDDPDFEMVMENSESDARALYREEAKKIEEIRKGIIEVSGKEEPYDIFICYKETDEDGQRTLDSVLAQDVYEALTDKGYRVFFSRISLEDKLGTEYEPYIFAALNSAKIMLVFGTSYDYFNAVWVKNEWARFLKLMASNKDKYLIPCYKNVDAYDIPKEFAKFQAQDMGKVGATQDLLRGIDKLLKSGNDEKSQVQPQEQIVKTTNTDALLRRGFLSLEDQQWEKAQELFDSVLNELPECSEAYLGLAMTIGRIVSKDAFAEKYISGDIDIGDDKNLKRAMQFADSDFAAWMRKLDESKMQADQQRQIKLAEKRRQIMPCQNCIAASSYSATFGLKTDGTVLFTGSDDYEMRKVSMWRGIIAISAGDYHVVGLKSDGTVLAAGNNKEGACNVSQWKDIIAVSAGGGHTVGLKADGTVVATGNNKYHQCEVSQWKDIIAISVGHNHTVGLKKDGSVVAVGDNSDKQCDVSHYKNIIAISAGYNLTCVLQENGIIASSPRNYSANSKEIIAIASGLVYVAVLSMDGTVRAEGYYDQLKRKGIQKVSDWKNIVAIAAGHNHTIGLKEDGSVVAVGDNNSGQCDVSGWKLFNSLETIEEERKADREKAEEQDRKVRERQEQQRKSRIEIRNREKQKIQDEINQLKGLFAGKRKKELEEKLKVIDKELTELQKEKM